MEHTSILMDEIQILDHCSQLIDKAQYHETVFLLDESHENDFFKDRKSNGLQHTEMLIDSVEFILNDFSSEYDQEIDYSYFIFFHQLNDFLYKKRKQIYQLSSLCLQNGNENWGLIGELNRRSINIESSSMSFDRKYLKNCLHYEKAFLLSKDLKYEVLFDDAITSLSQHILLSYQIQSGNSLEEKKNYTDLLKKVSQYQLTFKKLIKLSQKIGLDNSTGIRAESDHLYTDIRSELERLKEKVAAENQSDVMMSEMLLLIFLCVQCFLVLIGGGVIIQQFKNRIDTLSTAFKDLRAGHFLDEKYLKHGKDELHFLSKEIFLLSKWIENVSTYAKKIRFEERNYEYPTAYKQGELPEHLAQIEERIIHFQHEKQLRHWITEGMNKFLALLREKHQEENIFDVLTRELSHFIGANQMVFYITDNPKAPKYLIAQSFFAFQYKRNQLHQVSVDEGLIGQAFKEKHTLHLTDVPNNYTSITSGLGDATPSNLLILPLISFNEVVGLIEIASFKVFDEYQIEFLEKIAQSIAATIADEKTNITHRTDSLENSSS